MKETIQAGLNKALAEMQKEGVIKTLPTAFVVQAAPDHLEADYATNLALVHAAAAGMPPMQLAERLAEHLDLPSVRAEVAKPGFINFYCAGGKEILANILQLGERFGAGEAKGPQERVLVEYVSANPTGPLHIGHARAAALGSSLVNVMRFVGYEVDSEYYINDSGRQMQGLTASFCLRVLAAQQEANISMPDGTYQGKYLDDLARQWLRDHPSRLAVEDINELLAKPMDADERLDALITSFSAALGSRFAAMTDYLLAAMLSMIKTALDAFCCSVDRWYRESDAAKGQQAQETMERLRANKHTYAKDGALWFGGQHLGDDKDRVLRRRNGKVTYFANDILYHQDKYQRGYQRIINIWGADHHGYIARMRAAMKALNNDDKKLEILLVQLVFLTNAGQRISMSTRAGRYIALEELTKAVGVDATRFLLLMQKADRSVNFDVELAVSHSRDNPIYYVQYAHARLANILVELKRRKMDAQQEVAAGRTRLDLLTDKREQRLVNRLAEFPAVLAKVAATCEVHKLPLYLRQVAGEFHAYYNAVRVLDAGERTAPRLCLCLAIKHTLANGLRLLGVAAPERM